MFHMRRRTPSHIGVSFVINAMRACKPSDEIGGTSENRIARITIFHFEHESARGLSLIFHQCRGAACRPASTILLMRACLHASILLISSSYRPVTIAHSATMGL